MAALAISPKVAGARSDAGVVLLPCHRHLLVLLLLLLLLPLPPPPLLVRHMTVRLQRLGMHHIDDGRPPRHALWVLGVLEAIRRVSNDLRDWRGEKKCALDAGVGKRPNLLSRAQGNFKAPSSISFSP